MIELFTWIKFTSTYPTSIYVSWPWLYSVNLVKMYDPFVRPTHYDSLSLCMKLWLGRENCVVTTTEVSVPYMSAVSRHRTSELEGGEYSLLYTWVRTPNQYRAAINLQTALFTLFFDSNWFDLEPQNSSMNFPQSSVQTPPPPCWYLFLFIWSHYIRNHNSSAHIPPWTIISLLKCHSVLHYFNILYIKFFFLNIT
jgi:hypothetical protein